MTAKQTCARCNGEKRVYNAALKKRIRCPVCTRKARSDYKGMREFVERERTQVSIPEQERMAARTEQHLREAIADQLENDNVPEHLKSTHRVLQRWAAEGTGAPAENEDLYHESRPPPLDPTTYAVVEGCIATLSREMRSLVRAWYRTNASTKQLAARRQISVRTLGRRWTDALNELKREFLDTEHADLVALVRMQP